MKLLEFPFIGDQRNLALDLNALDLDACTYTIRAGDQAGALAPIILPGLTAETPILPPPGTVVKLPPWACAFLKQEITKAKKPGVLKGHVRWLEGLEGLGIVGSVYPAARSNVVSLVQAYVGYSLDQPKFEEVTQGRNHWGGYSACGDLWNFVLWRLGVRDQSIVNRLEPGAGLKWYITENLSRPIAGAQKVGAWVPFKPGLVPKPGDLVLIGHFPEEVEHGLVHLGASGSTWTSGDYGQVDSKGKPSSKTVTRTQAGGKLGSRTLIGWVDIDKLPKAAAMNMAGAAAPGSKAGLAATLFAAAAIAAAVVLL